MAKVLIDGNSAIAEAAIRNGVEAFFGYPITPQTEVLEHFAERMPEEGRVFLQAESEIASINMVYGAASAGARVMSSSSSPGISLMQEGISYSAGSELPCVVVDVMRGGPGLGNIAPEQSDYHQVVWGGGHGNYRTLVLAPNSPQEMCDLTMLAFDLADRYRNPAVVLVDGFVGQMMEPVEFPEPIEIPPPPPWAVTGTEHTRRNLVASIHLDPHELEQHNLRLQEKYRQAAAAEQRHEEYRLEDAEVMFVGYGIVSRILRTVVERAREQGVAAGLFRPISLWPFPSAALLRAARRAERLVVVEMSNGQMVTDVRLAVGQACPVELYTRMGGVVPAAEEMLPLAGAPCVASRPGTATEVTR
jgi:pyruvate/2-oxoacid:ferredoxin oxidoreductase alpha subunit